MSRLLVVAHIAAKANSAAGRIEDAIAILASASREERGCECYDVFASTERSGAFLIREIYKDSGALAFHKTTDHVAEFKRHVAGIAEIEIHALELM